MINIDYIMHTFMYIICMIFLFFFSFAYFFCCPLFTNTFLVILYQSIVFVGFGFMVIIIFVKEFIINGGSAKYGIITTRIGTRFSGFLVCSLTSIGSSSRCIVILFFNNIDLANKFATKFKEDAFAVGSTSVFIQFPAHLLDSSAYFQGRA